MWAAQSRAGVSPLPDRDQYADLRVGRRGTRTTRVDAGYRAVPGRVERQFQAQAPDHIWVADITYVPTLTGFVYLAVVLDVFSRRVVGWSMAHHLRAELVLGALNMALAQRRPYGVVHHSDKGSQYTSLAFGKRCREMGVLPSTGSTGDVFSAKTPSTVRLHAGRGSIHGGARSGPAWRPLSDRLQFDVVRVVGLQGCPLSAQAPPARVQNGVSLCCNKQSNL